MVVSTYWGQHYSRVAAATTNKAEGIIEEGTVDEEWNLLRRLDMGKLVPWMEVPPSRRPRILLVWWLCPRVPVVKILHRRLRGIPLMVRIG